MKRRVTLYWNSIGLFNVSLAAILWPLFFWLDRSVLRRCLIKEIQKHIDHKNILLFGSARSSLAFLLRHCAKPGDEVIICAYTCLAVPTAVIAAGLIPVYVDLDGESLHMNQEQIWNRVTAKTRAIVVQHTLGNVEPVDHLIANAHNRGILVIEDCALSIGSRAHDKYVGQKGDAAIYSMELSKTLSCGWGGILALNSVELQPQITEAYQHVGEQNLLSSSKDLAQTFLSVWANHPALLDVIGKYVLWVCWKCGFFRSSSTAEEENGIIPDDFIRKMGSAQMILAIFQWKQFETIRAKCERNFRAIASALETAGFRVHAPAADDICSVASRVSFSAQNRDQVAEIFSAHALPVGTWFDGPLSPLPKQSIYNYSRDSYPASSQIADQVLNIPCHSRLSLRDVRRIEEIILSNHVRETQVKPHTTNSPCAA